MKQIKVGRNNVAIVDDSDYIFLNQFKWSLAKKGKYIKRNSDGKYMHRIIMDAQTGTQVDHINGDAFDNQRSNLRLATQQQNRHNHKKKENTKNKYIGVSVNKNGTYSSRIRINKISKQLGVFKSEIAAGYAYYKEANNLSSFIRYNDFDGYTIDQLEELLISDRIQ